MEDVEISQNVSFGEINELLVGRTTVRLKVVVTCFSPGMEALSQNTSDVRVVRDVIHPCRESQRYGFFLYLLLRHPQCCFAGRENHVPEVGSAFDETGISFEDFGVNLSTDDNAGMVSIAGSDDGSTLDRLALVFVSLAHARNPAFEK